MRPLIWILQSLEQRLPAKVALAPGNPRTEILMGRCTGGSAILGLW